MIFPLTFFWPNGTKLLADPNNFPFPFNVIIASEAFQERITRWQSVNLGPDANPVVYSGNLHCWIVMTLSFLVYFTLFCILVGFALSTGALQNTLGLLTAWLIAGVMFVVAALILLFHVLTHAAIIDDEDIDRRMAESETAELRKMSANGPPGQAAAVASWMLVPFSWFENDLAPVPRRAAHKEYELQEIHSERAAGFARY